MFAAQPERIGNNRDVFHVFLELLIIPLTHTYIRTHIHKREITIQVNKVTRVLCLRDYYLLRKLRL